MFYSVRRAKGGECFRNSNQAEAVAWILINQASYDNKLELYQMDSELSNGQMIDYSEEQPMAIKLFFSDIRPDDCVQVPLVGTLFVRRLTTSEDDLGQRTITAELVRRDQTGEDWPNNQSRDNHGRDSVVAVLIWNKEARLHFGSINASVKVDWDNDTLYGRVQCEDRGCWIVQEKK